MKRLIYIFFVLLFLMNSGQLRAQQVEKKILATLQSGEEPMYYESCIPLSFSGGSLHLVTRKNSQFYIYENGTRKGPVKDTQIGAFDCNDNGYNNDNCSVLRYEEGEYDKFVKYGEDGTATIVFKGKTYPGFAQVSHILLSADGSKLAVLGANADWEPLFLTPQGKIIHLQGEADRLILSPSGSIAIVSVKGSDTQTYDDAQDQMANMEKMAKEMEAVDFSKMTPEEMTAYTEKLQEKYGIQDNNSSSNDPDYFLFLSDGSKLGPFKPGNSGDNPAFCKTGGENWFFVCDNKLYINGNLVKDFGETSVYACNVWISPDGKRYAVFADYEKLIFSDGQSYQAPIQIKSELQNGKAYLTWLTFDSSNQLILYKKAL